MDMRFCVEDEFAEAIKAIDGVRIAEVLGNHPGHLNADFAFIADSVVAELKCLDKDQINDDGVIEKASNLYAEELIAGNAPIVVFGEVQMTTADFSDEYAQKIADLYRVPIERVVKKAANQIFETVSALKLANPIGLLLMANDNHSALDPSHLQALLHAILSKPDYASIDIAIVFSGNLAAAMPGISQRVDYWIPLVRKGIKPATNEFLGRLREAWVARLEHIFETKRCYAGGCDIDTLVQLESRRNTSVE
jgi:hypothetical protein